MADLSNLLAQLSPEQRELLQLRLKKQQGRAGDAPGKNRIPRRDPARQDLPLSFGQQRLWFLDQWDRGNPVYNIFGALRMEGMLDLAAIARTFEEVVRRHEALRTSFTATDGKPRQVIAPLTSVPVPLFDLSALNPERAEAEGRRLANEHGTQRFDLARGPLARMSVVRLSPTEHWACLSFHHIVSDGWSWSVFNRELAALYSAFRQGAPSPLPPLPIQYADYAVWQRDWLQGKVLESQLAFWKELLAGAPSHIELPFDHPRAAGQGAPAGQLQILLPRSLADRLQALVASEGGTLFMVLLAGYALLLARYAGCEDVVVGSPVANRNRSEIEGLIGFFVSTLALRVNLAGDPTGRELLRRSRTATSGAYDHQDMPFELLIDELDLERDPSHPPLVQVALSLQNLPPAAMQLADLRLSLVRLPSVGAKFDLLAALNEVPEGINGNIEYNCNLFERATVERMRGHFAIVLEEMVSHPDRRISGLALLSAGERHQLIFAWNDTAVPYPREVPVHRLVAARAAEAPDALAVAADGSRITYGELVARARRLARRLRALGVGPEERVAVLMERSAGMVVALLAVLEAGGAYVPLDPAHPWERLAWQLDDAWRGGASRVLLTQERLAFPEPAGARVLCLDGGNFSGDDSGEWEPAPLAPESAAYVIYTSGSTGRPKGVVVPHQGLANLVEWHRRAYRVIPEDRATQIAGPGFDASVWEIWPYLAAGASLHVPGEEVRSAPDRLVAWLAETAVTLCFLPTPLAEAALAEPQLQGMPLRALLTGGDRLHRSPRSLPFALFNHYGPTENTVVATCWEAVPGAAAPPIGGPIANVRAHVLDRTFQPVPAGTPGELVLGGESLARGYLHRPELTAERFLPDPFAAAAGARLYRTGDLVRRRAGGELEFLGRIDHQVKVRGFRIELGEIEAALLAHPDVREAAVLVREDVPGNRRLAGYVVPKAGAGVAAAALGAFLGQTLPDYMVPAAWVFLEVLPLTPNGKVDRRALPAPENAAGAEWIAPRNTTEALLAGLWAELLGVERVGAEDDFFKLGGHSLLATQLISRIHDTFGVDVSFFSFFKAPTVAGLAGAIIEQRAALVDEADLAEVLAELEGLSLADLQTQPAAKGQPALEDDFA